jgi:MoxR-like ATPase
MTPYPFKLVRPEQPEPLADRALLRERPFSKQDRSFAADASRFVPSESMTTAINTAIAVGEPLLITGEPGTGKTQAAYYVAYKLALEPVIHFQVKSDTSAHDLLYHFDTVRYFHDANLRHLLGNGAGAPLDKAAYVERRALWEAFTTATAQNLPCVLLIDEIDKAPRDFPNDLLHELDKMEFTVIETGEQVRAPRALAPIIFITSNSERRLPEAFLRRCVYHHIRFDDRLAEKALFSRRDEYANLSDDFLKMALDRFLSLRDRPLRKRPSTGELLVWLRVLSLATNKDPEPLAHDLAQLPYLEVLIKDRQDLEELGALQTG